MASEKAWYWIAVGVLALFVSNNFLARHEGSVRCLADRSLAAVERISSHADRFVAMAEMMLGRGETGFARTQTAVARAQTRMASVEAAMARQQAACARVQAAQARMMVAERMNRAVICSRPTVRLNIPQPPRLPGDGTI